jgi:hypothetical protein
VAYAAQYQSFEETTALGAQCRQEMYSK